MAQDICLLYVVLPPANVAQNILDIYFVSSFSCERLSTMINKRIEAVFLQITLSLLSHSLSKPFVINIYASAMNNAMTVDINTFKYNKTDV